MLIAELSLSGWVERVRAEYLEMPGLSLTKDQMRRLWRLDASLCDAVVDSLVRSAFLRRCENSTYARIADHVV